jgi:hypothetical protein
MLNEFLTWWTRQMLDLLPERVRNRNEQLAHALIAEPDRSDVHLILRRNHRESDLGTFRLDEAGSGAMRTVLHRRTPPRSVILRLRPGTMLEREVVLPLAAERDIGRVLT